MFCYTAFGLNIYSEVEVTDFLEGDLNKRPDVTFRLGEFPLPHDIADHPRKMIPTEQGLLMYWRDIGTFLIEEGSQVSIMVGKDVPDPGMIRTALIGPILGMLLYQRNSHHVFHSSVVGKRDGLGALSFMATKGGGKSSMATAMCNSGYSLLSDDLLSIESKYSEKCSMPIVQPGFPGLKLWETSARALVVEGEKLPMIGKKGFYEKRSHGLSNNYISETLPLNAVFLLSFDEIEEPIIETLSHKEALVELLPHWYGALFKGELLPILGYQRHFVECTALAKSVKIHRLIRPHSLEKVGHAVDLVDSYRRESKHTH